MNVSFVSEGVSFFAGYLLRLGALCFPGLAWQSSAERACRGSGK